MTHPLINLAAFQAGWLATILGAQAGAPLAGPVYMSLWLALHLRAARPRSVEARLVIAGAALGYAADSMLVLGGWLAFPDAARLGAPSTIWMVTLWMGFAATLRHGLRWLSGRYWLAALLGALFGPLAYFAGAKLGAVTLEGPALVSVGLVWLAALPGLVALRAFWEARAGAAAPRRARGA